MHLLIVEDDLDLGVEIQRSLNARGFTSEWVRSAHDAQVRVHDEATYRFACVVLDIGLPDGEGISMLHAWRRAGLTLPVVLLTARDALASRVSGLDAGADDYVIKPVAPEELASRIRAITRRASGQSSANWEVGGLRINLQRHEVSMDGQSVSLSPREFDILAELARHVGKVVPKHHLARAVAPLGEPVQFNALEFHVHNLRRKLGQDCIQTLRGIGYQLRA